MAVIIRAVIRLFYRILNKEWWLKKRHDGCESYDTNKKEAEISNVWELVDIRSKLKQMLDPAFVEATKSTAELVIVIVNMMRMEDRKRIEYKEQSEKDLDEILIYDVEVAEIHVNRDIDKYWEDGDYKEVEDKYLEDLRDYVERIKEKKQSLHNQSLKSAQERCKEIRHEEIAVLFIFSCLAMMNSDELVEFVELGHLLTGNKSFIVDLHDFVQKQQDDERRLFHTHQRAIRRNQKHPVDGKASSVEGNPTNNNITVLSVQMLNEFWKAVVPKLINVLIAQLNLVVGIKRCMCIEINPNKTIRVTINNAESQLLNILLTDLERKVKIGFPIYEIRFDGVDFGKETGITSISHRIMKSVARVKFENCIFKNNKFDLSSVDSQSLDAIKELRIIKCNVKGVKSLKHLKNLDVLDICGHSARKIPKSVLKMKKITELRIRNGKLRKISNKIKRLVNLETLSFSGNKLKRIPKSVTKIKNLKKLVLSNNGIKNIKKKINGLTNLEVLILDQNDLWKIGKKISLRLPKLKYLSMRQCNLWKSSKFNRVLLLPQPKRISLFSRRIDELLPNLEKLDLSTNSMQTFPKEILKMKRLKSLILRKNSFSSSSIETVLKDTVNALPMLERLVLSDNYNMENVPSRIFKLGSLKELIMSRCGIRNIPKEIALLEDLIIVDFSHNRLQRFPIEVSMLPKLENLDLSNNNEMPYQKSPNVDNLLKLDNSYLNSLLSEDIRNLADLNVSGILSNLGFRLVEQIRQQKIHRELRLKYILALGLGHRVL